MGNIVLTANWDPSDRDIHIKKLLENIALKYKVGTGVHPNMGHYIKGYSQFSAEISGFSIPLNGGSDKCIHILERVSEKWLEKLSTENIRDVKINIDNLPM